MERPAGCVGGRLPGIAARRERVFYYAGLRAARRAGEVFGCLHPHRKKLSQEVRMEWGRKRRESSRPEPARRRSAESSKNKRRLLRRVATRKARVSRRNLSLSCQETRRTSAKAPDVKVDDWSA